MDSESWLWDDDFNEPSEDERDEQRDNDTDGDELTPEQIASIRAKIEAKRFEPIPYEIKGSGKRIAVVDCETDPFAVGVVVKPFALGFLTEDRYVDFWGNDCVDQFFEYLATQDDEYIIYAHNGGKFDFFFFLKYLDVDQTPLIINSRLVKINFGGQEFRDSYAIIPEALKGYKKEDIDYSLFTPDKRERHRQAILDYQKSDCVYTLDLINGFHKLFGDKLTIASASLPMLNSYHGFERMKSSTMDERFRDYYYGGRVQCFETGILTPKPGKEWRVYDRNSMYPSVMRDCLHPISARPKLQTTIDNDTDFACIEAINYGALPTRSENGSLNFTTHRGTFFATIHEINAGLETDTLKILRVKHAWAFDKKCNFVEFVMRFYNLRLDAKAIGDKVLDILYKFCLNSAYGKFALNPRKFKQWIMTVDEVPSPIASPETPNGWSLEAQSGDIFIWSRPNPRHGGYYNVATAASITGAARANLWRNINRAERPIYCDTDSIICQSFSGDLDASKLGGWKLEASGDMAAIAGKKLYAVFNRGDPIKKASKGVNISPADIIQVAKGREILYENPVPNFGLDGSASFTSRRVNKTG